MSRTCRLVRAGRGVDAQWRRDGEDILLSPTGGVPFVVKISEVSGISGDGFTVRLRIPGGELALERLGADGPTLLAALRRDWPVRRAAVLRLTGGEEPAEVYAGAVAAPDLNGPCRGFFAGERLIVSPEAADITAIFLADQRSVTFEEEAYAVVLTSWDGAKIRFSKLGGRSTSFATALLTAHEALAQQAAAVIARFLPALAAESRVKLAAEWLPGRLLSFQELEEIAPGFEASFLASWFAAVPRAAAGKVLMDGLGPSARYLGYAVPSDAEDPSLWLLVRRDDTASLELLSHDDCATYLFNNADTLPGIVEWLVRMPDFSREALYLPLEQLVGERGLYAIPARDFPPLRRLRKEFVRRKIHAPTPG